MPNIKTFCRIKPTSLTYPEHETSNSTLYLRVPELLKDFNSNSKGSRSTINHEFNFDHIFMQDASQQDVFDVAALEIVKGFLNGYNGTIFAYGQTALSMVYKELEKRSQEDLSVHISYLEIYQDVAYDLLNPGARIQGSFVTPFPKVTIVEGPSGSCIVRNQTNHLAASEDVAQSLLLQGQANRKVAATAVHDRSSRSHAVFSIQLTAKKIDSDTIVRSKLHLVDLAGSERVAKTRVLGHQLTEAKSINLSLHYLETVIVALQEEALNKDKAGRTRTAVGNRKYQFVGRPLSADALRGPRHVPYRNSQLTMLLRDSLGGNCMTSMIATISLETSNLGESISTCRFAGRVACIANAVSRNEELDEKSLIRKLRKRIAELETELACLRLSQESGEIRMVLTEEDKVMCVEVVNQYLAGKISDPISAGITNPHKFRECLKILKRVISQRLDPNNNHQTVPGLEGPPENGDAEPMEVIQRHNAQKLREEGDGQRTYPKSTPKPRNIHRSASFDTTTTGGNSRGVSREESRQGRQQTTQAWTDESRVSTADTGERLWTANSKKDPETLSQLLNESDVANTPFDKKRVQEIKKLNSKVEKLHHERTEQEQQVMEMKMQLHVATAQVTDQAAYIKQLLSTEADSALIEQERLVEKQLKRRRERYERQLEYITFRKDQLKQRAEGKEVQMTDAQLTSMQEKFGQFRKRDGSLNTRQVFAMLKTEERKQSRAKTHVEREKIMAKANLMEMKELATRQKLRELKEAMASGKPIHATSQFDNSGYQNGHVNGHVENEPQETEEERNNENGEDIEGMMKNPSRDHTFVNDERANRSNDTHMPKSSSAPQMAGMPSSDFYSKRKSEKDPTSKWESSYSRPTTPSNLAFQQNDSKPSQSELNDSKAIEEDNERLTKPERKNVLSEEDLLEIQSKKYENELDRSRTRRNNERMREDKRTYMPSEYVNGISNGEAFDARKMNLSAKNFDSALNSMLGQENSKLLPDNTEYEQYARTSKYRPNPYLEPKKLHQPQGQKEPPSSAPKKFRDAPPPSRGRKPNLSLVLPPQEDLITKDLSPQLLGRTLGLFLEQEEGFDMQKFLMSASFNTSGNSTIIVDPEDDQPHRVKAMDDQEREKTYMSKATVERNRVNRIRKARMSAEIIQRAWRRYIMKKRLSDRRRR
ncbi:KIF6-like protein [Mya arenaria]|uniref:KIF6-like protein n=1 Tax=Mya arenaria TaxID=6604 RepID=A0ABY7E715_MYAAR|nr:KIF6-like protein [Mya arenaria]